ncbi:MAG: hypothetical protein KF757_13465 [Phycisphaeraceae bacterium]|nr:hypothetical protein [Phycisphaeraceae bacterium]
MADEEAGAMVEPQAVRAADLLKVSDFGSMEFWCRHRSGARELARVLREPKVLASFLIRADGVTNAEGGWVRVGAERGGRPVFVFVIPGESDAEFAAELVFEQENLAAPWIRVAAALDPEGMAEYSAPEYTGAVVGRPMKLAVRVEPRASGSAVQMTVWMPSIEAMGAASNWFDRMTFRLIESVERWVMRRRIRRIVRRLRAV